MVFALGRETNPKKFAATAAAFINMITMLGGVIFQPLCGFLLDWHSGSTAASTHFNSTDFKFALSVLPLCFVVSCMFTFMLKETNCKTVEIQKIPVNNSASLKSA
ncbi:MAG: major facilitator family transporter [uncultured bacterium]|nr:MAG: major facilitator family transporter [uncultured bacterium]